MGKDNKNRVDRWLWAVRVFKTRSLAAEACRSGRVKINDISVKPARVIAPGDQITVRKGMVRYRYEVVANLEKRVGAKLVEDYMKDVTPQDELDKIQIAKTLPTAFREKGSGRPTKKDRREMDQMWEERPEDFEDDF